MHQKIFCLVGGWVGGGRGGGYVGAKNHNLIFFSRHDFFVNLTIISERNFWKKFWGVLGGSTYRQKFKIKKILQNMTFIANYMIPSLINFWKKNFIQKFFKVLEEGGTYMQITKIKKMFQNMIFLRIIGLLVKEISEKKFSVKKFSDSGGGVPTGKKSKLRKCFKTWFFGQLYDY